MISRKFIQNDLSRNLNQNLEKKNVDFFLNFLKKISLKIYVHRKAHIAPVMAISCVCCIINWLLLFKTQIQNKILLILNINLIKEL